MPPSSSLLLKLSHFCLALQLILVGILGLSLAVYFCLIWQLCFACFGSVFLPDLAVYFFAWFGSVFLALSSMSASPRSLPVLAPSVGLILCFIFLVYICFIECLLFCCIFYCFLQHYRAQPVRLPFVVVSHYMSFLRCSAVRAA